MSSPVVPRPFDCTAGATDPVMDGAHCTAEASNSALKPATSTPGSPIPAKPLTGYPIYSAILAADDDLCLLRRFDRVHARDGERKKEEEEERKEEEEEEERKKEKEEKVEEKKAKKAKGTKQSVLDQVRLYPDDRLDRIVTVLGTLLSLVIFVVPLWILPKIHTYDAQLETITAFMIFLSSLAVDSHNNEPTGCYGGNSSGILLGSAPRKESPLQGVPYWSSGQSMILPQQLETHWKWSFAGMQAEIQELEQELGGIDEECVARPGFHNGTFRHDKDPRRGELLQGAAAMLFQYTRQSNEYRKLHTCPYPLKKDIDSLKFWLEGHENAIDETEQQYITRKPYDLIQIMPADKSAIRTVLDRVAWFRRLKIWNMEPAKDILPQWAQPHKTACLAVRFSPLIRS
ncbi:hypothetical protein BJX99DRAFT_264327 [Aspergillus californicus]